MIHDNSSQQESASTQSSIQVGAFDWQRLHWSGDFYPDDLPEDWRLSYYANEFSAVLVPAQIWQSQGADIEHWCDEVHEGFRFYLHREAGAVADIEKKSAEVRQRLGAQFAGFVDLSSGFSGDIQIHKTPAVAVINVQSKNLRAWSGWLQDNASGLRAVFLNDQSLSYKELNEFKSLVELLNL